jgi:hypothetical protein
LISIDSIGIAARLSAEHTTDDGAVNPCLAVALGGRERTSGHLA